MAKMFVNYSKTKAEFVAAGLPATYNESIVFIKGDAQGNGSCIYTHGMYFANFAEFMAAIHYVKGITVGGESYNAASGGGYLAFNAADPSSIKVNAGQNGIEIGLTEAFVTKVNDTYTNLGTPNDSASSTGSAFARIANLVQLVSDLTGGSVDSIEGQITNAINALREEIVGTLLDADDAKTIAEINDELNSIDSTLKTHGTDIGNLEEAVETLNGNDSVAGSVDKKIKDAINEFATKISDDNTINTFKELIDYAAESGSDLADLTSQVNTNKGAIETLNGGSNVTGSVDKKVADAIAAEVSRADGAYATKAQGTKADTAYQKPSTGIPKSDLASDVQTSLDKADTALQTEQYKGTVTGVKINGTTKNPDANGLVDLGEISGGSGGSSGGSGAYAEVSHGTNDTTFELTPNTFHVWDEVASLTLTLGAETSGVANEYLFQFLSGSTPTTLSLPDDLKWPDDEPLTPEADKMYQLSILKGAVSVLSWSNAPSTISFYIKALPYYADRGSTWDTWVGSDYNTEGWQRFDDFVLNPDGNGVVAIDREQTVSLSDTIIEEFDYTVLL